MSRSFEVLLEGLIDYAGLFPPAALGMAEAVRNYAAYRGGPHRSWLGRFVVPVGRLAECEDALAGLFNGAAPISDPWRLSALAGRDLGEDLETLVAFNARGAKRAGVPVLRVDALEIRVENRDAIAAAMARMPQGVTPYFEIPIAENPAGLLAAIAQAGGRAKVRAGGVTPDLFPAPVLLARFLVECARARVPFKATAGLHHPLRSVHSLTYEPGAPQAMMHGFLNLFLAAAFADRGLAQTEIEGLMVEQSPRAISFGNDGVQWRSHRLDTAQLQKARETFSIAFGSCSFEEPIGDLKQIGLP